MYVDSMYFYGPVACSKRHNDNDDWWVIFLLIVIFAVSHLVYVKVFGE